MPFYSYAYLTFLYALFLTMLGLAFYHRRLFSSLAKDLPAKASWLLIALFLFSLFLRLFLVPRGHIVYYDEFDFLNLAQNIYHHNAYGLTAAGDRYHLEEIILHHRPGGYALLLSVFFRFLGPSAGAAFLANALLGSASVALVFLCVHLLFHNPVLAFWSGFATSLLPVHLRFSGCASSDISSFFFLALALLAALLLARTDKTSLWYLLTAILVFASYIRPENAVFLIPLLLTAIKKHTGPPARLCGWFLFLALASAPLGQQLFLMARIEDFMARGPFWLFEAAREHLPVNLKYLFSYRYNLVAAMVAALAGLPFVWRQNKRIFIYAAASFAGLFILCSGYFHGVFLGDRYVSDSERYFLPCALALAVFSGAGIYSLIKTLGRPLRPAAGAVLAGILAVNVLAVDFLFVPRPVDKNNTLFFPVREVEFLKRALPLLDASRYIVTDFPGLIVSGTDRKAMWLNSFLNNRPLPEKAYLLKTHLWEEGDYGNFVESLRKDYAIEILDEEFYAPSVRTVLAELRRR